MQQPRNLLRLAKIYRVLRRHHLDEIIAHLKPRGPLRFFLPAREGPSDEPLGRRVRLALEDLGPIFVKFGQALSTRPDLLPVGVARELAKLQDDVPPFPGSEAREILEKAFGQPVGEVFASFDETPRASASIAQVHDATLKEGDEVVVKVLRPGVEEMVRRDLDLLHMLAALAERYWEESRRLRPRDIVAEYEKTITDELDLLREAANASQLKRNFPDHTPLYIPQVHWDYCKPDVMVMERIHGVPVSDLDTLQKHDVSLKVLADRGVEIFFTQVFKHNFFHADMHPGNIFIDISNPDDPTYIAVDFGIVGTLTSSDKNYLAGNLLAFFKRDYHKVAQLHVESGWVPPGTRVDEFESAIRTVSEPIFNRPIKEISFGQFLVRLFRTARRFNMEVQPQLVLLQKTLLNIEGLGRQIYPDLDLWQTAKPFLEEWTAEQISGREMLAKLRGNLPELSESLQNVPHLVFKALQQAADGKLTVQVDPPGLSDLRADTRRANRRRYGAIAGGSMLVAAAVLVGLDASPGWLGWALGAVALVVLWTARPRSGA